MIRQPEHRDSSGHIGDELPALLSGELDRDGFRHVVGHLKDCDACRRDLVDVSAANAALRAVASVIGRKASQNAAIVDDGGAVVSMHKARTRRLPLLTGVAAAAVAVCAVGSIAFGIGHHQAGVRKVELVAVGSAAVAGGTVTMTPTKSAQEMEVRTVDLTAPPAGSFYEVWLFNAATGKMLPVGVLSLSGSSDYQLADDLVAGYTKVDVSLQQDDGNPAHSKTSVLRASYG